MDVFYKIWKKYDEIQLTENKMDLNNRKIKNHPTSPIHQLTLVMMAGMGVPEV